MPENCPALILTNSTVLTDQNYQEIIKWNVPNVGRVYGKFNEPNIITCANVQSYKKLEPLLRHIKVLIVDEVHVMMSKIPRGVYKKLKNAGVRIGLSATPFKFGGRDKVQKYSVKGFFGPLFKTSVPDAEKGILKTKTLQGRETLSKSKCVFYPIREPVLKYAIYQDAITQGIAESSHFHDVVKRLCETLKGRTLILVERIAHGDALNDLIPGSLWVKGKDDINTRNWVKEQLQKAKGNVVAIATNIFTAGVNVFCHNLINAASGQADHQIIQRMGRGLRIANDKVILNYFDFVFFINEYLKEHSLKRIKVLEKEGHEIIIKENFDF